MMRTPDATAQLVQLRQTEVIRAFNNNGVGCRDVDPGFDNGCTNQHVETLMMEIIHHPFQFALAHLPVTDGDPRFWHQFCQPFGGFLNVFHIIVEIINLSSAQNFTQDRLPDHQTVILADKRFDRQTTGGRRGNNRQIAHSAHRHIQRTWDRRSGKRQNIHVRTHRFNALFMTHPEAVFFIDNQQA